MVIWFWLFQTRRSPLLRNLTVAPARRSRPSPRANPAPTEALVLMAKVAWPGHTLTMPHQRPKLPASSPVSNQVNDANKTSTAWLPSLSSVPPPVLFHCHLLFFSSRCCFLVSPFFIFLVPLWSQSVTSLPCLCVLTSVLGTRHVVHTHIGTVLFFFQFFLTLLTTQCFK